MRPPAITGVPVTPSGMTSPHGKLLVRGVPRLVCQRSAPERVSNAYTESFSVATMTSVPSTSGSA